MKILAFASLLFSFNAFGVCFETPDSPVEEFNSSEVVVIVEAISSENNFETDKNEYIESTFYTLRVIRTLKGQIEHEFKTYSENSSGRYDFKLGEQHLLFINLNNTPVSIDNCGFSMPFEKAQEILELIEKPT